MDEVTALKNMVRVKSAHLRFFWETPLYYRCDPSSFDLYKPKFMFIDEVRRASGAHPDPLFYHTEDKQRALREMQFGLNEKLGEFMASNDPAGVKETLVDLFQDAVRSPTSENVEMAAGTVNRLVDDYLKNENVINTLVSVVTTDYTTAVHSINVMTLTIRFGFYCQYSLSQCKELGLAALLHDVGKTEVSTHVLKAPRRLTDHEFEVMKQHTIRGYRLLSQNLLPRETCLTALQHHERVNGSGYPFGATSFCWPAEVIGFIDCFEAITCHERPYRAALRPYPALWKIRNELFSGKFNKEVFRQFVLNLAKKK
jgi:HD-GYP domain-containing protein (c-di-GMP phosphodiesterase class II)